MVFNTMLSKGLVVVWHGTLEPKSDPRRKLRAVTQSPPLPLQRPIDGEVQAVEACPGSPPANATQDLSHLLTKSLNTVCVDSGCDRSTDLPLVEPLHSHCDCATRFATIHLPQHGLRRADVIGGVRDEAKCVGGEVCARQVEVTDDDHEASSIRASAALVSATSHCR